MTFGGSNFNDFSESTFLKMPILVHFEDEGTLLVVFKMHSFQQQKTGVSIKI